MSHRDRQNRQTSYRRRHAAPFIDMGAVKRSLVLFIVLGVLSGAYYAWSTLTDPDTLPFYHIKIVTQSNHIDVEALQDTVASNLEGGFFSLNSQKLRTALLDMPWVEDVALRIIWPDTLEVDVIEQQPLARWNNAELINTAGNLFQPPKSTFPKDLPLLEGSDQDLDELIANFHVFNKSLSAIDLSVRTLKVDSRRAWFVVLNNGIRVTLGRESVNQRFSRFVRLYPSLIGGHIDEVSSVDLRYPNGFTIAWKDKHKHLSVKT